MDFFTFGDLMEYIANPVGMFTIQHFIALLLLGILGCSIIKIYKNEGNRSKTRIILSLTIVFCEVTRQIVFIATNAHAWEFLPLHLCAFSVYIILIDAFVENKFTKEIMFMLTLPGAFAALITPDWATNPLINFFTLQSFIIHALQVTYVWMRFRAGELEPKLKNIWIPGLFLTVIVPIIFFINNILETNFFFLMIGPSDTPLEVLQSQFGDFYIASLAVFVFMIWILIYSILNLKEKFHKQNENT